MEDIINSVSKTTLLLKSCCLGYIYEWGNRVLELYKTRSVLLTKNYSSQHSLEFFQGVIKLSSSVSAFL